MPIIIKNKDTLIFDDFVMKCCIGKRGFTKNIIEGDKKTQKGKFNLGNCTCTFSVNFGRCLVSKESNLRFIASNEYLFLLFLACFLDLILYFL